MSYKGWKNYETWNVALWISSTQRHYHVRCQCADYEEFREKMIKLNSSTTPDNVNWFDSKLDIDAINEMCFEEGIIDVQKDCT